MDTVEIKRLELVKAGMKHVALKTEKDAKSAHPFMDCLQDLMEEGLVKIDWAYRRTTAAGGGVVMKLTVEDI